MTTSTTDAFRGFPVLAKRRDDLVELLRRPALDRDVVAAAIESDVALVMSALALANSAEGRPREGIADTRTALAFLTPDRLERLLRETYVFDFFEPSDGRAGARQRFALHASAVQRIAERLGRDLGHDSLEELRAAALLHDVGKLPLGPVGWLERPVDSRTPDERVEDERRRFGTDHAAAGGALARRLGLPERLAEAIERHHDERARGAAAIVRLADLMTHYRHGDPLDLDVLLAAGHRVGLGRDELGSMLYDITDPLAGGRSSPLSYREQEVLRSLARGRTYKEIALELGISASTVRGHLHRIYGKLDVVDRAQAVLMAADLGWV